MRRALVAGLALALGVAAPVHAAQPWYEAYGDGVKAVQARQWAQAESRLRAAIQDGPRPGRQIRAYGMRFVDYFPDYYLGIACFHQEKWREAADAFHRMEATGLFSAGDPELENMNALAQQANVRLAAAAAPPATLAPTSAPVAPTEVARTQSPAPTAAAAVLAPPAASAKAVARPATPPQPDAAEQAGVRAFRRGEYQAAIQILGALPTAARSPRAGFYLACSNAALGFLQGPDGAGLVETARAQFALARRVGLKLGDEERYISPRILALYRSAS
jgi:hypothetical protein